MRIVQLRSSAERLNSVALSESAQTKVSVPVRELEASREVLSTIREESPLLQAFFDERHKVVELPTFYMRVARLKGRPETSRKTIAGALKSHCEWLERWPRFGGLHVDDAIRLVDVQDIVDWIAAMREEGLEPTTVHNREVLVKQFYVWLTTQEAGPVRESVPWSSDKKYVSHARIKHAPRYVEKEDVIWLLRNLHNESQRCLVHFLYDTGLRISEAVALTNGELPNLAKLPPEWDDCGYVPMYVRGVKARGGRHKLRITLVSRAVLARIKRYHATPEYRLAAGWATDDPSKPVFLNVHGAALTTKSVQNFMRLACIRGGEASTKISPHRLRHGTAFSVMRSELGQTLVEKLLTVKAMFGHENFSTTERYTTLLGVLEAIRANRDAINRAQEADEIDRATFLARQRHTEKRGHKR